MSTDQPDREFVDDRETQRIPEDAPIREIAPDDFVARSSESTLRAALIEAERQTSRDADSLPRCPECLSIRIRTKAGHVEMDHMVDEPFKCVNCTHHFATPAPSREAAQPGDQATLREVTR